MEMHTNPGSITRPYDPHTDEAQVYALWQRMLGETWPLERALFRQISLGHAGYRPSDHLVAERAGQIVGFIATSRSQPPAGAPAVHIIALLVDPDRQRQGLGRSLVEQVLAGCAEQGIERIEAGGGPSYFWPGIPLNLPAALPFFTACGWQQAERTVDMLGDLSDYSTPTGIFERCAAHGVKIGQLREDESAELLEFERREFPDWHDSYVHACQRGQQRSILLARSDDGEIAGSAIIFSAQDNPDNSNTIWRGMLGQDMGGFGVLGVAEARRRQGIGLALAARASELLRDQGVRQSYLGWTWLVEGYGKLGYRVWREYQRAWRPARG